MEYKLDKAAINFHRRNDEELGKALDSVKIGFARMVYIAEYAPDLALNLFAIYDLLVELKWMRERLEEVRKQRKGSPVGAVFD